MLIHYNYSGKGKSWLKSQRNREFMKNNDMLIKNSLFFIILKKEVLSNIINGWLLLMFPWKIL